MGEHECGIDFPGEQERTFPTEPTRLSRSTSSGSGRSGRRGRQSASPPERNKGKRPLTSTKQKEAKETSATALQNECGSLSASKSRNRLDKDLADTTLFLGRMREKLRRSEDNERGSRQLANDARKLMTETNKTLQGTSAQDQLNKEKSTHRQGALHAAELFILFLIDHLLRGAETP